MSGGIIAVENDTMFAQEMEKAGSKIVVVDFFATWCGPCQRIAPNFAQMSHKFKQAVFLKVDVDKCEGTTATKSVSAMPTFHVYKAGTKIDELRGADPLALEKMVEKHCAGAAAAGGSEGGDSIIPGMADLFSFIETPKCECLNESDDHTFQHCLKKGGGYLESDCDEQLLLTVAFLQPIRLHSLIINAPEGGKAPKTVKVFVNMVAVDFDGAERGKAVQELTLEKDDVVEGAIIPLTYVKFQNVCSVTVFVKDNQGDEETTQIDHLAFIGQTREKSDMNEFKRVSGTKGEAHS